MKLAIFLAALTLSAETVIRPPQIGLPVVDIIPQLVALVDGKLATIEVGTGITLQKTSAGNYRMYVVAQPVPTMPQVQTFFQWRLTKLANGNYPACAGMLFWNGQLTGAGDFSIAPSGEIVAPWPAIDTITCVTIGAPAAMSLPK